MIGSFLLDSLWQGALVAAIAAAVVYFVPRRHAATRYAVWFSALIALAVLPVVAQWHPTDFGALPTSVIRTTSAAKHVADNAASAGGTWLVVLWIAGVAFSLARLALSYVRISRIVRDAAPAPDLGPEVLLSNDVATPIAAGIVAPAIVIPAQLPAVLERSELDAVIRHERAHLQRKDVAGNLVQRLIEACFFFNPWAYAIGRQLVKERESACDDWAVDAMPDPGRYASCLARLALMPRRSPALLTPSAIGSKSLLLGRIARLVNGKAAQLKPNYLVVAAGALLFAALGFSLQAPRAVASTRNPNLPASCWADASVQNPAMPNIPNADLKTNLSANAVVDVDAFGKPVDAKIVKSSGNAAVDQATVNAAMASTYKPALKDCKPAAGQYLFHVQSGP